MHKLNPLPRCHRNAARGHFHVQWIADLSANGTNDDAVFDFCVGCWMYSTFLLPRRASSYEARGERIRRINGVRPLVKDGDELKNGGEKWGQKMGSGLSLEDEGPKGRSQKGSTKGQAFCQALVGLM